MGYFIKTTIDGTNWQFFYGENAVRTGSVVAITKPFAAIPGESSIDRLEIFSGSHSWSVGTGWIYAHKHKSTLFNYGEKTFNFPKWVPEHLRGPDITAAAEYALRSTPLSSVFRKKEVLRAIAEEMHLETIEAVVHSAITVPENDELIKAWAVIRPEAYAFARADADRVAATVSENQDLRRELRMEAHRKIDAELEKFTLSPSLGGEPWIEMKSSGGFHAYRYGRIKSVTYPQGEKAEKVSSKASNEELLLSIENSLIPGDRSIEQKLRDLKLQRLFFSWETKNPLPSIGYHLWGDEAATIGFTRRPGLNDSALSYSLMGIACTVSDPAKAYLETVTVPETTPEAAARFCLTKAWTK